MTEDAPRTEYGKSWALREIQRDLVRAQVSLLDVMSGDPEGVQMADGVRQTIVAIAHYLYREYGA